MAGDGEPDGTAGPRVPAAGPGRRADRVLHRALGSQRELGEEEDGYMTEDGEGLRIWIGEDAFELELRGVSRKESTALDLTAVLGVHCSQYESTASQEDEMTAARTIPITRTGPRDQCRRCPARPVRRQHHGQPGAGRPRSHQRRDAHRARQPAGRRRAVLPRGTAWPRRSGCATCASRGRASCASASAPRRSPRRSSPTTRRCRCCASTCAGGRGRSAGSSTVSTRSSDDAALRAAAPGFPAFRVLYRA